MKRKVLLSKSSFISTLDFIIAPTGLDREQASIAINTIVRLCKGILLHRKDH